MMINLTYDLHIHSCLSPCGDEDMTPANIVGMAALKQLDVIAITDHNSCKNCEAAIKAALPYDITIIPGMEICTMEEVHALCLFPCLEDAMLFDAYVYKRLPAFANEEKIFGRQLIYNESDQISGKEPKLLINATEISFEKLHQIVIGFNGIMIPAHIDKPSNSLISNLGFVPPDSQFKCAELKSMPKLHELARTNPYLNQCKIISNSDAHYLEDINEPNLTLLTAGKSPEDILSSLEHVCHTDL